MPSLKGFKKRFSIFVPSFSQTDLTETETVDSAENEPVREEEVGLPKKESKEEGLPKKKSKQEGLPKKEVAELPKKEDKQNISLTKKCCQIITAHPYFLGLYVFLTIMLVAAVPFLLTYFYPLQARQSDAGVCSVSDQFRFECFPDVNGVSDKVCDTWNCCWKDQTEAKCYHRFPSSYRLNTTPEYWDLSSFNISRNVTLQLKPIDILPEGLLGYGQYYTNTRMTMVVDQVSGQYLRARLLLNPDKAEAKYDDSIFVPDVTKFDYEVHYEREAPPRNIFTFRVSRAGGNSSTLFGLNSGGGLVLSENYTEATILLPSSCSVFGLGLGNHRQLKHNMTWNAWALFSNYTDFPDGGSLYGSHPVYMCLEEDGQTHGVLLNNSYLMEARLQPAPAVTFRTVGGDLDFHIVVGPKPMDVIAQLSQIPGIEKPAMPPYWALGYHICPVADEMSTATRVIDQLLKDKIPFESSCIDADAWKHWQINPKGKRFSDFKNYAAKLQANNRTTLIVAFPQVLIHEEIGDNETEALKSGENKDIFVKDPNVVNGDEILRAEGELKGSLVAYPDPTNPRTSEWMNELLSMEGAEYFDGFLLHWNTPVDDKNRTNHPCESPLNYPPFLPSIGMNSISEYTLCMDALYYSNETHAAMQNQYGRRHAQLLYDALLKARQTNPTKRPFILSLSTQTGSGRAGGHWGGEYLSTWDGLKTSFVNMLEASIYGIPLSGAPIGGNTGSVTRELWSRWYQLGAFYPLALSFYDVQDGDKHPAAFPSLVHTEFAIRAIQLRYSLLPYLYTLFHEAATLGRPVARPMFFEFPEEKDAVRAVEQFMWGPSLLLVPCLRENATTVDTWIPPGKWFELRTGSILTELSPPIFVQLPTPQFSLNVFQRSGSVIPMHDFCSYTTECRKTNYTLLVALECNANSSKCVSSGNLYLDDGESTENSNLTVYFTVTNDTLYIIPNGTFDSYLEDYYQDYSIMIQKIRVYGLDQEPADIIVDNELIEDQSYDKNRKTLTINTFINLTSKHEISWH